jgi:VIT1/CCC1 family predicted Fe2+/Mn2+ transporter
MDKKLMKQFLKFQQDEMDGYEIYWVLGLHAKNAENAKILTEMAYVELNHANLIQKYTKKMIEPGWFKTTFYRLMAWLFGFTFVLKMLENDEGLAKEVYKDYPELMAFSAEEEKHEAQLIKLINEKRLKYIGSIVLGLNDALVEFTGALAGFTLALSNSKLIALTASITAIAGALSMGASEYLSNKTEGNSVSQSLSSAVYTGLAFIITVIMLILPFVFISTPIYALIITLVVAVLIIAIFNFYYAVVCDKSFHTRFAEMAVISFSIAAISFLLGYLLKMFTGIDVQ